MRDRFIEILREPIPVIGGLKIFGESRMPAVDAERYADHLLANGVIVPPCKVGDTVWYLNRYHSISMLKDAVYEAKVVRVYVEKENTLCLSIQIKNEWGTTEFPHITEIGKTVFLTKEEAERALN